MNTLTGKTADCDGREPGIGRAIALHLAAEGASVVLTARDIPLLDSAAAGDRRSGRKRGPDRRGFARARRGPAVRRTAIAAFGGIDILVNNAGATKRGSFEI